MEGLEGPEGEASETGLGINEVCPRTPYTRGITIVIVCRFDLKCVLDSTPGAT